MANATTADFPTARASFDAYCARHAIGPDTAIAELVHLALGLPADVLDYLREQFPGTGAAA
jgi:hypothetical protein